MDGLTIIITRPDNAGFDGELGLGPIGILGGSVGGSVASGGATGTVRGIGGSVNMSLGREVTVEVTGTFTGIGGIVVPGLPVYQNYNASGAIRSALEGADWNVVRVIDAGLSGANRKFLVSVSVRTGFSDSQVLSNMQRDLSGVMTVRSISKTATASPSTSGAYSGGSNNSGGGDTGFFGAYTPGGFDLTQFAIGGLSGGLVIGIIALVVLLKK